MFNWMYAHNPQVKDQTRPDQTFTFFHVQEEEVQTPEELWQVQDRYQKAVEVSSRPTRIHMSWSMSIQE